MNSQSPRFFRKLLVIFSAALLVNGLSYFVPDVDASRGRGSVRQSSRSGAKRGSNVGGSVGARKGTRQGAKAGASRTGTAPHTAYIPPHGNASWGTNGPPKYSTEPMAVRAPPAGNRSESKEIIVNVLHAARDISGLLNTVVVN